MPQGGTSGEEETTFHSAEEGGVFFLGGESVVPVVKHIYRRNYMILNYPKR